MKTVSDLADAEYVYVTRELCRGRDSTFQIAICERPSGNPTPDFELMSLSDAIEEADNLQKAGRPHGCWMIIEIEEGGEYWRVQEVQTSDGWGPLLYDIAMELVTEKGASFRSDDNGVKPDAIRVWEFYENSRKDVSRKLCHDRKYMARTSLQYAYQKSPATTVERLKELAKWKERSVEICDEE